MGGGGKEGRKWEGEEVKGGGEGRRQGGLFLDHNRLLSAGKRRWEHPWEEEAMRRGEGKGGGEHGRRRQGGERR